MVAYPFGYVARNLMASIMAGLKGWNSGKPVFGFVKSDYNCAVWILLGDKDWPVLKHGPRSLAYVRADMIEITTAKWKWTIFQCVPTLYRQCLMSYVVLDWVIVHILGPERLWIIPELVEAGGNSGGGPCAVLTCKSLVRVGYRGERPIEQSGSWFPPKFLSG